MGVVITAVILVAIVLILGITFGFLGASFLGRKKDGPGPRGGGRGPASG